MKRYDFWLCQNDGGMDETPNGEWVNIKDLGSYALIKKLEDRINELSDIIEILDLASDNIDVVNHILDCRWRNK